METVVFNSPSSPLNYKPLGTIHFLWGKGGGLVGIWEAPFKNRMTPLSLPIFSHGSIYSSHFLDDPPTHTHKQTKINPPS